VIRDRLFPSRQPVQQWTPASKGSSAPQAFVEGIVDLQSSGLAKVVADLL
jgi:hypothetical protein